MQVGLYRFNLATAGSSQIIVIYAGFDKTQGVLYFAAGLSSTNFNIAIGGGNYGSYPIISLYKDIIYATSGTGEEAVVNDMRDNGSSSYAYAHYTGTGSTASQHVVSVDTASYDAITGTKNMFQIVNISVYFSSSSATTPTWAAYQASLTRI